MRLVEVKLKNFRAYGNETAIAIDRMTVLVGRNDAGKSSILDALDIFFNDADIEKDDCCVHTDTTDIQIACVFEDLPTQLVLDEQYPTSLQAEYLLRGDGRLEVVKTYGCGTAKGKLTNIVARANHPSVNGVSDLLGLKITDLRTRAQQRQVDLANTNQAIKAQLRQAIWGQAQDLQLADREVGLTKESGKEIWQQLEKHLPVYALFKSDRASTDQDSEAQDPLKTAIKEAIRRREADLNGVIGDIRQELERVANRTVDKIREMNPDLANQLHPEIKNKNWDSLFTVSLTGDEDIPINKRGSGTRRLVLLNFFRAKAEEDSGARGAGVIYAVEEPETSQHPNHQIMLLEAFDDMVMEGRCQVLLTTHTPTLARRLDRERLRFISLAPGAPTIEHGHDDATLQKIKDSLGVLPDHDVKAFVGVEGKHDINFLRRIANVLAPVEPDIPDLELAEKQGKLVFVPLAGSNLELWITTLAGLHRPEFYLTDRDLPPPAQPKYHQQITAWAARGCTAWATSKRELENYLHPTAITAIVLGYTGNGADFEDVPMLFAEAVHSAEPNAPPWAGVDADRRKQKASVAKRRLNTVCVERMTPVLLTQSDPNSDIRGWLRAIGQALNA
jgi:putative ATP-dependent endonuclease of the OLD family